MSLSFSQLPMIMTIILKVECSSCREVNPKWITINKVDFTDLSNSRGEANLVIKCKFCSRESSASVDTSCPIKPYDIENSGKFAPFVTFECRGLEFVEFEPRDGFLAFGAESRTKSDEIDLTEGEWADYDEKSCTEVSIMEIESKFEKL
ncbi:hypothetical protein DSO57_1000738 [Entomophthora muscae]|uniref:Uncharacterized protein n=1 Tax=Entomophthora muscae TaxID=34485 RepID=A0ACC2T9D9_9FUNG|nr:hypothetical protein DSO57_1000738 [Entomophthora muscae]